MATKNQQTIQRQAKTYADKLDKQTQSNKLISKDVAATLALFLAFWYAFVERNDDYDHADDSKLADEELKAQLDKDAKQNDVDQKQASNNDDLLQYAGYVYASILASKLIKHVGGQLSQTASTAAKLGQQMYGTGTTTHKPAANTDIVDQLMSGAKWSDRIWANQDQLRAELTASMKRALLTHKNPVTETAKLRKQFDVADYQARRILRTESARVMNQRALEMVGAAGYKKVIWVTNSSACRRCLNHEGRIYTLDEAESLIPYHPNCLCTWAAVMAGDSDDELTRKAPERYRGDPLSYQEYTAMVAPFIKSGGVVQQGPDTEEYLDLRHADGITVSEDAILLRLSPTRAEVLEELYHVQQLKEDKFLGQEQRQILMEIDAQHYLLDNANRLKLTRKAISDTKKNLKMWEGLYHAND